jgi:DNA replication and repair protein RecF
VLVRRVRMLGLRNLAGGSVAPGDGVTLLWGPNGAGKTSFLEGICLGLTGGSPRTRRQREAIAFGEPLARVEVDVAEELQTRVFLWSLSRSGERRHQLDGSTAQRDDARRRPALAIFVPDRLALVKGPPGERRAHLDRFAATLWPGRAEARRRYGRALAQRNSLLHRIRAGAAATGALDAWDLELASAGAELIEARSAATARLAPAFAAAALELGLPGEAELAYRPRADSADAQGLAAELAERRSTDVARGFSGHGPHLDELSATLAGRDLRRYGSQGEQRAGLLALLFAERRALIDAGRPLPLMLLDDVMSELDAERRELLAARLVEGGGQVVVTATEPDQLPAACPRLELAARGGAILAGVDGAAERAAA